MTLLKWPGVGMTEEPGDQWDEEHNNVDHNSEFGFVTMDKAAHAALLSLRTPTG